MGSGRNANGDRQGGRSTQVDRAQYFVSALRWGIQPAHRCGWASLASNECPQMTTVTAKRPAGPDHQVVTIEGGHGSYRREPCEQCPWRVDRTDEFPAEAFRHSANTAYDMATHTFACHMSGTDKPACCAGFLLNGAFHNLAVRMRSSDGRYDLSEVYDGGHKLHPDYRSMAVANGCDEDDDALSQCRGNGYGE